MSGADLLRAKLLAWLDRPCPPGSWRDFEPELELLGDGETRPHLHLLETGTVLDQRNWEEFELARAADPLMEAGHA